MIITDTLKKALSILKEHDFYYMMTDSGYNSAAAKAKASMEDFVKVTNTLPSELRQLMRDLWIATYEWCACFQPMWTSSDHKEKEIKMKYLQSKVESLVIAK